MCWESVAQRKKVSGGGETSSIRKRVSDEYAGGNLGGKISPYDKDALLGNPEKNEGWVKGKGESLEQTHTGPCETKKMPKKLQRKGMSWRGKLEKRQEASTSVSYYSNTGGEGDEYLLRKEDSMIGRKETSVPRKKRS